MGTPVPEDHLIVGRVEKPHGLMGEVSVRVITDNEERFAPDQTLYSWGAAEPLLIRTVRHHKHTLLVQFAEVVNRTEAESLRGSWLSVPESEVPEQEPGTWWIHDIVGSSVITDAGTFLGVVTDVVTTGANDVWEIRPDPALGLNQPVLLPATREVVTEVDIPGRSIKVHLIPGLLPE